MAIFPLAAGQTDWASNSASPFIPEIWSSKLLRQFLDSTVYKWITNMDYEGEIKNYGDSVVIRTTPLGVINSYVVGGGLVTSTPTAPSVKLQINRGHYWNESYPDVHRHQMMPKVIGDWAAVRSEQLAIEVDKAVLGAIIADPDATNKGATAGRVTAGFNIGATGAPVQVTAANVISYIIDLATILNENNVPKEGRYIVMPPWMTGLIAKSEIRDSSLSGDPQSLLRSGNVGNVYGFELFENNHVATTVDGGVTVWNILFGNKMGVAFANQIEKIEQLRNQAEFGDLIRGLYIYGFKTIYPKQIGLLYAKR